MSNILYVFGAKSTAIEIKEIAEIEYDYDKVFLVDKFHSDNECIISEESLSFMLNLEESHFILGMSNHRVRKKCLSFALGLKMNPISILSKHAYISSSAKIGLGVYIAPNTSVSTNAVINDHCVINYNTTIGHDSIIKCNTIVNPGVRISGNCVIGEDVLIGANSFIFQGKEIASNVSIDAMTHVFKNITENKLCTSRSLKVLRKI